MHGPWADERVEPTLLVRCLASVGFTKANFESVKRFADQIDLT